MKSIESEPRLKPIYEASFLTVDDRIIGPSA
jgi:hypothetical protein